MIREPIVTGEIYHVYNRGVEKRNTFTNQSDYFRFVHCLHDFNDIDSPLHTDSSIPARTKRGEVGLRPGGTERDRVVDILAFCLMKNHYHLMVKQRKNGGITSFMRKLGTGYTNYFNLKYERVGPLFQGKFKYVRVSRDEHLSYLPHYIHLNPLDYLPKNAKPDEFVARYQWSSLPDYLGVKNFPTVTERKFLLDLFGGKDFFRKDFFQWIEFAEAEKLSGVLLD